MAGGNGRLEMSKLREEIANHKGGGSYWIRTDMNLFESKGVFSHERGRFS